MRNTKQQGKIDDNNQQFKKFKIIKQENKAKKCKQQTRMQLKLPSPQEIYDLSTDQLSKLKQQLSFDLNKKQHTISNNKNIGNDTLQSLRELLQNIQLEIEERKTIEFFTQLCINDGTANKYVKEITNFNNQFKKLANEMLNNQSTGGETQKMDNDHYVEDRREDVQSFVREIHQKEETGRDGVSQTTINSVDTETQNHTLTSGFSKATTYDLAGKTFSKKMGLGNPNMKKNKTSIKDFIKATLSKSKAIDYVSTKGGMIKNTPDKFEKNGSHFSSNNNESSRTPLSTTKSMKPPSQGPSQLGSHRSENKRLSQSSNKNIPAQSNKSTNDKQSLMKKRNDAIQKMKHMKKPQNATTNQSHPPQPPKKKTVKGLNPKSLVEMVKLQQDAKKKRQQQQSQQSQKPQHEKNINKDSQKQQQIPKPLTPITSEKDLVPQKVYNKEQQSSNDKRIVDIKKTQLQFPIKQQINPVLSSSDTQSDTDSVKLIGHRKTKNNLSKQGKSKKDKYCTIPQQEIQESIAAFKQIKAKEEENIKKNLQHNGPLRTQPQIKRDESNAKSVGEIKDQRNKVTVKKSIEKRIHQTQVFGKITEQQYNPDGYDDYNENVSLKNDKHQQQPTTNNVTVIENKQQDNDDNQARQPTFQTQKQQELIPKTTTKTNKSQRRQSQKDIITSQKNQPTTQAANDNNYSLSPNLLDFQSTKMYNEQYWLHIKQEAESKIQRFKQEKQIQRKQRELKAKILEQQSKRIKAQLQERKLHKDKKLDVVENTLHDDEKQLTSQRDNHLEQDINDRFIQQQRDNLKKIYAENNANGSNKKATKKPIVNAIIRQPKPSFPKPEFNYLEVYPSFNHIFNVFYTKPEGQAVLDIPLIMKEMVEMFQTHIDFQKSRKNSFRPAIFLPFDSRNPSQFTDARQLLQHAQTTYVNLKTLIERVDIFNSNIQGQFQNCTDEQRQKTQFYRVVKTRQEVYDIISTSFLRRKGWKELPHGQNLKANWNLFWSWSKPQIDMNKLLIFQRINHYPFNKNLSRKDLLYKNIDTFRKSHKVPFPYLPITYNLPKQFTQFSKRFHQQQIVNRDKNYWIMKPIGKSRGRGIKLINSLSDLNYLDNIVVQKYISNPLLIDGYKFDMRIYVLVTSFHPLEAFVYRQGFARFSTEKYSLEPMDMKNNFVHLTNFAINKDNKEADDQKFSQGSKISLKALKQRVTKMGYSFANMWTQVHQIIIKSLLACSVTVPPFPAAFQLFGYDIMLDDKGQCYLIQINSSPSLQRSYMIDEVIKQSLIDDIIEIVNPPVFSKQQAINVMNERLTQDFRVSNKKAVQKGANANQEEDLVHIARILNYQKLRKYGEMPDKIGLFEMVAPSPISKDLQKLIKSKSGINAPHNID